MSEIERAPSGRFWDREKAGTYLCATCKKALFKSSDKIDNGSAQPLFRKPLSEADIQYRKIPDAKGQLGIRCKKCQSSIGYVIGGDNPHYRLNAIAVDFEQSPYVPIETQSKSVDIAAAKDSKEELSRAKPEEDANRTSGSSAMSRLLFFLGGATIGLIIGAAGAYYFFQTFYPARFPVPDIATSTAATSTDEVIDEEIEEEPISVAPAPLSSAPTIVATTSTTTEQ